MEGLRKIKKEVNITITMGVLDSVMQMKSQGKSEAEIIQILQNQRIPPREIQDALSQAYIKNAVAGENYLEGMQGSIMDNPPEPQPYESNYIQEQTYPQEQPYQQTYPQQYPYVQQEDYQQDQYAYPQPQYEQDPYSGQQTYPQSSDTNSLIEISEQVFTDKVKKIQDTIDKLSEFKTLTDSRVKLMEERLKRIEQTIDQLQASILDKVSSYGQNLSSIKKEMSMMQDSFGKLVDPFLDRKR